MLIVVVDDEPVSRRLIGTILRKHNLEAVEFSSGKEAIDYLQGNGAVRLIVSDVLMPGLDGFDMLRFLRADERFRRVPVILVTALNDTESVLKGIELGAQDYVTKPISAITLIAKVEKILSPRRPRILVVDREAPMRNALVQIVGRAGFAALDVASGEEALTLLKSNQFLAIIADSELEGMTGVAFLKAVKRDCPQLPVLLVTGSQEAFSARQLLLAGADAYISKPFHNVEIVQKLRNLTGQAV